MQNTNKKYNFVMKDMDSNRKLYSNVPMELFLILSKSRLLPHIDGIITECLYRWLEENDYIEPVEDQ